MGSRWWNNFIDIAQGNHDYWKKILEDFDPKKGILSWGEVASDGTNITIDLADRQRCPERRKSLEVWVWLENIVRAGGISW